MPPSATAPDARKRLSGEARREAFLDSAAEIIAESGIEAVTMEGIATRSGVNKALGYRYFANRDALLIALAAREWGRLDDALAEALAGCTDFADRVRAVIGIYMDAAETDGLLIAGALSRPGSGGPELTACQNQRIVAILQFFADLIMADFGIDHPTALEAAAMISAGVAGLVEFWLVTGAPRDQVERHCAAMCLGAVDGLAAST